MKIEDKWEDIVFFYVSFSVQAEIERNTINKLVAFKLNEMCDIYDYSDETVNNMVKKYVYRNFKNVKEVLSVDLWEYGLLSKNEVMFMI